MISDQRYLNWQKRITESRHFKQFWTFCGIYSVAILLALSLYFLLTNSGTIVGLALLAFILGRLIISPAIFFFYKKPRPYQALKYTTVTSWFFSPSSTKSTSFPSDHAISFAAISAVYIYFFPHLGAVLILLMLLNGAGRVILGYHYIVDVLAGWFIGLVSAFIIVYYLAPLFTK